MLREISDTPVPIKIWASNLDSMSEQQARRLAALPFIYRHVALMPDAHPGMGSTVGSVIATRGAILPAAVGVDLGCGMCAMKLPLKADQLGNLKGLRSSIEKRVPVGKGENRDLSTRVGLALMTLGLPPSLEADDQILRNASAQLGSLGGGNHFIEICIDREDQVWIMLHSGSRGVGNELATRHIDRAKGAFKELATEPALTDPNLAHFVEGTPEFQSYIGDMLWAQDYARANRTEMLARVLTAVSVHALQNQSLVENQSSFFKVDCHHNYCQRENHFGQEVWLTRKGAVSAREGEYGIIPGSMGAKSFIVRGKGNADSFHSCAHGAGRKMSRRRALELFTEEDVISQTVGVECRKDKSIADEIPAAYKNIDEVMSNQSDLVEIVHELKQIVCVKGGG